MIKIKLCRKSVLWIGVIASMLTGIVSAPVLLNNNIMLVNDNELNVDVNKQDINFNEISISEIMNSNFIVSSKKNTNFEINKFSSKKKIAVTNEELELIENTMYSAIEHIKINGLTNDFYSFFTPTIDIYEEISKLKSQAEYENLNSYANAFYSNNYEEENLGKKVSNLKISKTTFATISATAAVAAAGFWAAAWWFGITTPWAIASTVISAFAGGVSAAISLALIAYDKEMDSLAKAGTAFASVYKLGHIFYSILYPILVGSSVVVTASSWAFPAALSLVPIIGAILSWITVYK